MKWGSDKETHQIDDYGSSISKIKLIRKDVPNKVLKQYRVKIKVTGADEESSEYKKFTQDLRDKRKAGLLGTDKEDRSTIPSFSIEYPKNDIDGTYFIIKSWTEQL